MRAKSHLCAAYLYFAKFPVLARLKKKESNMIRHYISVLAVIFLGHSLFFADSASSQLLSQSVSEEELRSALEVQSRNENTLFDNPGVVAVGVGLTEDGSGPAVHVYVNTDAPGASASAISSRINGVPVRVFETDEIMALDAPPGSNHKQTFAPPVPMGVSTGSVSISGGFVTIGTLGYRVFRLGQPNNVGYITNNHVAGSSGANLCPAMINPANLPPFRLAQCQPSLADGGGCVSSVGNLVQAIPILMGALYQNTVDAAFVKSNRNLVNKTILDIGNPSPQLQAPDVNLTVWKSGRTTGFTQGTIQSINVTEIVSYGACGVAKFVGQIAIVPGTFSGAGDSGSPVLGDTDSSGRRRPVGLLFAGSSAVTFANRISDVLGALHSAIDTR